MNKREKRRQKIWSKGIFLLFYFPYLDQSEESEYMQVVHSF